VGFVEDKLALIEVSFAVLRVSPVSVTVHKFHTRYRSHGRIILAIVKLTPNVQLRRVHEGPEGE
jgi:S-adenosylmethionine synthetase